jgi:hypothetical protein
LFSKKKSARDKFPGTKISDIDNDVDVDMIYVPIYIVESAVPGIDFASRHHDIVLFDSEAGGGLL